MCAVIGIELSQIKDSDFDSIRTLFYESQIRGKHATGVSYLKGGKVITIKEPISAEEFINKHDPEDWVDGDQITAIAHCRYSTSDLRYNQPVSNDDMSLVHNGVISQELPENWENLYGIKCDTANDSELLFHRPTLEAWENSSISALLLKEDGIEYMRNGKRPLWEAILDRGMVYASTFNIIYRSAFKTIECNRIPYEGKDLQP